MVHADACDVENDHHVAEAASAGSGAPSLPPRPPAPPADDVWVGVEAEPEIVHHQLEHHVLGHHEPVFLFPTWVLRVLPTIGWAFAAVACVAFLVAVTPVLQSGDPQNVWVGLDDDRWFAAASVVSSLLVYAGWTLWSMAAAFNAGRVSAMSTSLWLPLGVYIAGPIAIVVVGQQGGEMLADLMPYLLVMWIGVGHLVVVASLRSTASRIRGSIYAFSKLFWLPLAWTAYQMFVNMIFTVVDDVWQYPWLMVLLLGAAMLYPVAMALATWEATQSFDAACHRLNTRSLGFELPAPELITAAIRQRAVEGR